MANSNRDRLVATFQSRTKRKPPRLGSAANPRPYRTAPDGPSKTVYGPPASYLIPGYGEASQKAWEREIRPSQIAAQRRAARQNNLRARRGIGSSPPTPGSVRGGRRPRWD